jgi:hypothetical protein
MRTLPFPLDEMASPAFELSMSWDLDALLGYIGTWSAVQRYTKRTGTDPLPSLRAQIAPIWNSGATQRSVVWPLHLRVGRAERSE